MSNPSFNCEIKMNFNIEGEISNLITALSMYARNQMHELLLRRCLQLI